MKTEVIFITEIISPYRIPVFNEMARILNDRFLVFFLGETEKRRHWEIYKQEIKFRYEVLPNILLQRKGAPPYFFNPTIFFELIRHSPNTIIIGGYHHPTSLLALLFARLFRKKLILWCESNKYDWRLGRRIQEAYKRWFIRGCAGYVVPGKASFEYLLSFGATAKKIRVAPNAVDNDYFNRSCAIFRQDKEKIKQSKGYPAKLILYVGRLINEKGILDLFKAFQMLSREDPGLGLLLIGDGEEEVGFKDFCKAVDLKNVFFAGFVQREELPVYYAISDLLVLPSHSEPWGLVLNEAMACKLPVIASDAVGAAQDLIASGENGYIYRKGDTQQLAGYLKEILSDAEMRDRMGEASSNIIKDYSPLKSAEGFMQAIKEI